MAGVRALVIGDVIDDITVIPRGPIRVDTDTPAAITRQPGGSAANTAAWLGWLGTPVDVIGRVAQADRERHAAELRALGVTPHLQGDAELSTGTIVIVVDGETRTMLTDRGANAALDVAAVSDSLLAGAGVLHLTGYSLFDALTLDQLADLAARAHAHGVVVTFDPGSTGFITDFGPERFRQALVHVDVLLPNLDEARLLAGAGAGAGTGTGADIRAAVADALLEYCPAVVVTCGAESVLVAQRGATLVEIPVEAQRAVDPTGAGDAFTAGLASAMLAGESLVVAAAEGVRSAAVAVTRAGGRPPAPRSAV